MSEANVGPSERRAASAAVRNCSDTEETEETCGPGAATAGETPTNYAKLVLSMGLRAAAGRHVWPGLELGWPGARGGTRRARPVGSCAACPCPMLNRTSKSWPNFRRLLWPVLETA